MPAMAMGPFRVTAAGKWTAGWFGFPPALQAAEPGLKARRRGSLNLRALPLPSPPPRRGEGTGAGVGGFPRYRGESHAPGLMGKPRSGSMRRASVWKRFGPFPPGAQFPGGHPASIPSIPEEVSGQGACQPPAVNGRRLLYRPSSARRRASEAAATVAEAGFLISITYGRGAAMLYRAWKSSTSSGPSQAPASSLMKVG